MKSGGSKSGMERERKKVKKKEKLCMKEVVDC